jgi:hypothetical protein
MALNDSEKRQREKRTAEFASPSKRHSVHRTVTGSAQGFLEMTVFVCR